MSAFQITSARTVLSQPIRYKDQKTRNRKTRKPIISPALKALGIRDSKRKAHPIERVMNVTENRIPCAKYSDSFVVHLICSTSRFKLYQTII
jgi:hypothetical protein